MAKPMVQYNVKTEWHKHNNCNTVRKTHFGNQTSKFSNQQHMGDVPFIWYQLFPSCNGTKQNKK